MTHILIIDDDVYTCRLLERILNRNGYKTAIVSSGLPALDHIKNNQVDLVLCDFRLPDINGKELLVELKKIQPLLQVIIVSGDTDTKLALEAKSKGAFDLVAKPFATDNLMQVIEKALKAISENRE